MNLWGVTCSREQPTPQTGNVAEIGASSIKQNDAPIQKRSTSPAVPPPIGETRSERAPLAEHKRGRSSACSATLERSQ